MESRQKKCLITGASGLIGSRLVELASHQFEVFAVTRSPTKYLSRNIHNVVADLAVIDDRNALPENVDVIVHLAQSENFRNFPDKALDIFNVNVKSSVFLLDYARQSGVSNFILASSGGVYGYSDQAFTEKSNVSGNKDLGFYLSTRVAAEVLAESYLNFFDLKILRYFFVYGPGQKSDMLIPRICHSVATGREIVLQGENGLRINPIYVDDAAKATLAAMNAKTSFKANIAGSEILTLREIANEIGQIIGKLPKFTADLAATPRDLIGANDLMRTHLIRASTSFRQGSRITCGSMDLLL
jgi:UDP-glucose 4-epimerase